VLEAAPEALARSAALRRRQAALLRRQQPPTAAPATGQPADPATDIVGFDAFLDGYGHIELGHRGMQAEFALAQQALHRAVVTSDRPRPLFYFEWLHAAAHARDEAAIDAAIAAISRLWPEDASTWFWIAFADDQRGRTEAALAALDRALNLEPGFTAATVNRARLLRGSGRNAEAIAVLRAALAGAARPAFVHRELGTSLLMAGESAAAVASYEQALAGGFADTPLFREYGRALVEAGQVPKGYEILRDLVARQPGDHEARLFLGSAELARGQRPAAMEQLQRSIAIQPTGVAQYLLGTLHAQAGDLAAAAHAYEQAMALDAKEIRAPVNLALLRLREGDRAAAEPLLRRALAVDPAFLPARRALLRALDDRPAAAVAMCREWLQHAPDLPEAQRHLAWSLLRTGDAQLAAEARSLAQAADAALGGNDGPALHVLGAALLAVGDVAAAEAALARALAALDPADKFTPYYREQIEATQQQCRLAREQVGK
jgi:tetratricopeptide (TPR) repeat protein